MIITLTNELPIDSNSQSHSLEGTIKYYFFHGQWQVLSKLASEVNTNDLSCVSIAMLGTALKFHLLDDDIHHDCDELLRLSMQKGLDKAELYDLVLYDSNMTAARVYLLLKDETRAAEKYKQAYKVFKSTAIKTLLENRMINDYVSLGFVDRAIDLLRAKGLEVNQQLGFESKDKTLFSVDSRKVIIVAGMRHSGSTALFNILRFGGLLSGLKVFSAYSEKINIDDMKNSDADVFIIKTHEKRDDLLGIADTIVTTRRDLRDTVASAKRRGFDILSKLGVLEYAKYNRALHEIWESMSNYEFIYEEFINSPESTVQSLYDSLGIKRSVISKVLDRINNLPTDQYKSTLLSPTHITDKDRKLTFRDSLSAEELSVIEKQHGGWLAEHGYR